MKVFVFIILLIAIVYGQSTLYETLQTGEGTYYGTTNGGNCAMFKNGWPDFIASNPQIVKVAINKAQYDFGTSLNCGMCLRVVGSGSGLGANPIKGEYIAVVTDQCPECPSPNLDFALNGDGRWNIQWYAIDCPVSSNTIKYIYENSQQWYLKIQPRGSISPIQRLRAFVNGNWVEGTKSNDNFFIINAGPISFNPLKVQITNIFNETLNDEVNGLDNNNQVSGKGLQFKPSPLKSPTIGGSATTSAPTTAAPTTAAPTTAASTTKAPTKAPTNAPTTKSPTSAPTTKAPTSAPTTKAPTAAPTSSPGGRTFTWNSGSNSWWLALKIEPVPPVYPKFDCGYGSYPTNVSDWDKGTFILAGTQKECLPHKFVTVTIGSDSYGLTRP